MCVLSGLSWKFHENARDMHSPEYLERDIQGFECDIPKILQVAPSVMFGLSCKFHKTLHKIFSVRRFNYIFILD